jgi:hypothetical protein
MPDPGRWTCVKRGSKGAGPTGGLGFLELLIITPERERKALAFLSQEKQTLKRNV